MKLRPRKCRPQRGLPSMNIKCLLVKAGQGTWRKKERSTGGDGTCFVEQDVRLEVAEDVYVEVWVGR